MVKVQIRADNSVHIEGYVNAVARDSRVLTEQNGSRFVEQIMPGAFQRALVENPAVKLMLNHDRVLGGEGDNLQLKEDTIGLRASCDVTDEEVVKKAKEHKLRGWSFGFRYGDVDNTEKTAEGIERKKVRSLDLAEVSIIDDRKLPCYAGTSVEVRAEGVEVTEFRALNTEIEYEDAKETVDYSEIENRIRALEPAAE